MFVGRLMGRVYYFLIEKRFVVLSRLKNKLATLVQKFIHHAFMASGTPTPTPI